LQERNLKTKAQEQIKAEKKSAYRRLSFGLMSVVRDPLAAVLGQAQIGMEKAQNGGNATKYFQFIEREVRKTKETVESLLALSQVEEIEMRPVDFYEIVRSALDLADYRMTSSGVKLRCQMGSVPRVLGNKYRLQQAVFNLILNAIQSMEKSSVKELHVILTLRNDAVELRIQDSGVGISEEVEDQIFEPFFTTNAGGSLGLGLAVTKGVVESHKGRIWQEKGESPGTTFILQLPVAAGLPGTVVEPRLSAPPLPDHIVGEDIQFHKTGTQRSDWLSNNLRRPPIPDFKEDLEAAPEKYFAETKTPKKGNLEFAAGQIQEEARIQIRRPRLRV